MVSWFNNVIQITEKSLISLTHITRRSLEYQRSNTHSNVTKTLTPNQRSNTHTRMLRKLWRQISARMHTRMLRKFWHQQVPRTSVPITSIQRPVYPSSNNFTVEQVDTIEWISRWLQQDTNSWKEISESFKDGILMCEIVQDVFKVRGVPLSLTQLTCRSMA